MMATVPMRFYVLIDLPPLNSPTVCTIVLAVTFFFKLAGSAFDLPR